MNKTTLLIIFAAVFAISGCTVHHYHHNASSKKWKTKRYHKAKKSRTGHGLPPGHPPVRGKHGHDLPDGHPSVKGSCGHNCQGMRGHGKHKMPKRHHGEGHKSALPPGHPPVDDWGTSSDHSGDDTFKNPFAKHEKGHGQGEAHADHSHGKHAMPAEIGAFHDSFAAAWHAESEAQRRTAACDKVSEWKTLGQSVKKLKGGVVFVAATKDLHKQILSVAGACNRKKGDVQSALVATHDALHMVFRVLPKTETESSAETTLKSP